MYYNKYMTKAELVKSGLIPLDKSWITRMGILDLVNGYSDINGFLENQKNLGDDLTALKKVCDDWKRSTTIDVGESGTLYRFLQFASWKLKLNKKFTIHKTLRDRNITDNPNIVDCSLRELLKLDNETSQWASASVLLGNKEIIPNPPYKLALTYDAVKHWESQRANNKTWEPRYDETILKQAVTFLKVLNKEKVSFAPEQAEDYCFARAFNLINAEQGELLWPSLKGHESNRIIEMEKALKQYRNNEQITSRDHRVVQALAMKGAVENIEVRFEYPESVNKTWPQFWDFLNKTRSQI